MPRMTIERWQAGHRGHVRTVQLSHIGNPETFALPKVSPLTTVTATGHSNVLDALLGETPTVFELCLLGRQGAGLEQL